jgi:Holliday junction DNA helicase RuvB
MGKITLAKIIAADMATNVKNVKVESGKTLEKAGDVAALLTNLCAGDFLIIEQIEAMRKQALEVLVSAMADFSLHLAVGKGHSARSVPLKIPRFTVVGTTSKPGQVDERLSSLMFAFTLIPYENAEIGKIVSLSAVQQGINIDTEAASLLAEQSNGCPGEARDLLRKVHEYAIAYTDGNITSAVARDALGVFGPDSHSPKSGRRSIPDDIKVFVWQRDGGRCAKCGSQENLEYDHIIPVSKGGSNTARNIQLLCEKCNRSKSAGIV